MFRMILAMVRTVFFLASVTAAFIAGAIVANLDRLTAMQEKMLHCKAAIPQEVQKIIPDRQSVYTRPATKMTLTGRVLAVHDGDTLTMSVNGSRFKVRLFGIDAPELRQEYGPQSRDRLRAMVQGKTIRVNILSAAPDGSGVGDVICGDTEVNTAMVRSGCAWHCRQSAAGETALAAAETDAKQAKRGLWHYPSPVPPWEYRQIMNGGNVPVSGKTLSGSI